MSFQHNSSTISCNRKGLCSCQKDSKSNTSNKSEKKELTNKQERKQDHKHYQLDSSIGHFDLRTGVYYPGSIDTHTVQITNLSLLFFGRIQDNWEHAALVLYDEHQRLVLFDVSPITGECRLQLATNILADGWKYCAICPVHSPYERKAEGVIRIAEVLAASKTRTRYTNDQATRCKTIYSLIREASDRFYGKATILDTNIITPMDLYQALKTSHEYPNLVGNLTVN